MSTNWPQSPWTATVAPVAALAPDCVLTPARPQRPAQRVATAAPAAVMGRVLRPAATAARDALDAPPDAGQAAEILVDQPVSAGATPTARRRAERTAPPLVPSVPRPA